MDSLETFGGEVAPRLEALLIEFVDIGTIAETLKDEGFSIDKVKTALEGKGFVVEKNDLNLSINQTREGRPIVGFPKVVSWE